MESEKTIDEILRKPYPRLIIPDSETGQFHAEIPDFPGCFAIGMTASEALINLEGAARSWLAASLELGHKIPDPAVTWVFATKKTLTICLFVSMIVI